MEVRAEKNKRKTIPGFKINGRILRKVLPAVLLICLLVCGFVWQFGQKMTLAGYVMEKDMNNEYIFNVVEVVPEKNQAVLGNFIAGSENISTDKLLSFVRTGGSADDWYYRKPDYSRLFYWEGKENEKDAWNNAFEVGGEPFTLVLSGKEPTGIINNEIFKLQMMGIGKYNPDMTVYWNYTNNRDSLKEFDDNFVIHYEVMTPQELEAYKQGRRNIHYLHIGGGIQLAGNYDQIYTKIMGGTFSWNQNFKSTDDISWNTALELYTKALSKKPRMSVSISGYCMKTGDSALRSLNLYKFYQMLNYFNDPGQFKNLFKEGNEFGSLVSGNGYIEKADGSIHWKDDPGSAEKVSGDWESLNRLDELFHYENHGDPIEPRKGDYIPAACDNILLYEEGDYQQYFSKAAGRDSVNVILHFDPRSVEDGENNEDGSIRILEIEPTNHYMLKNQAYREELAAALNERVEDFSVTYVTPNRLNGMTVDLVAEYDLILIGENTDGFNQGSNAAVMRYSHIGGLGTEGILTDGIILQTLLNGLLDSDYTTKEEFEKLLLADGGHLNPGEVTGKFLKNVELTLKLTGSADSVSKARFSGNDINRYMQTQLAEFVKSGQPVVVSVDVSSLAFKQIAQFNGNDAIGQKPSGDYELQQDARIFYALFGVEDERDYFSTGKKIETTYYNQLFSTKNYKNEDGTPFQLYKSSKPSVQIVDRSAAGGTEDGNPELSVISESDAGGNLSGLKKSDTLTFDYSVGNLEPDKNGKANYEMTVIVDRNGDGIFDRGGDGKTKAATPPEAGGEQSGVPEAVRSDKVYKVDLSAQQYNKPERTVKGTFSAPENDLKDSIEEFYKFRVVVEKKTGKNNLRGCWTGYMRPYSAQRTIKVLQILPYGDKGTKDLDKNEQFKTWVRESETRLEGKNEFKFIFSDSTESGIMEKSFDTKSESQFDDDCHNDSRTAEKIAEELAETYDLIIAGTDFNTVFEGSDQNGVIDLDDDKTAEVLKSYINQFHRPVIFTRDSMSYVNTERYITSAEKGETKYRDLTEAEGKALDPSGKLEETSGRYKKVKISEREAEAIANKNKLFKSGGEGSTYFYRQNAPERDDNLPGTFKALVRPVPAGAANDGRAVRTAYIGYTDSSDTRKQDKVSIPGWKTGTPNPARADETEMTASQFQSLLLSCDNTWSVYTKGYEEVPDALFYYSETGYVTEEEVRKIYEDAGSGNGAKAARNLVIGGTDYTFYTQDIHAALNGDETIPADLVDTTSPVMIGGDAYYRFAYNGKVYLAYRLSEAVSPAPKYGYVWQMKDTPYGIVNVAGTADSLYPQLVPWNYHATRSLRYLLGMDRFAVTTDISPKDKRDNGTSRRYTSIKELQGFTNGALLEYAYLPPDKNSPWAGVVNQSSIFTSQPGTPLSLGYKPETGRIQELNDGTIGHYPFEITADPDNTSDNRIPVALNHAPFYQLDLERELGQGKIDDVTVWFTLAGASDTATQAEKDKAQYFEVTQMDAGNNYYLYSKGKTYYTGFSLKDKTGGTLDAPLVTDQEMQLFINTIYAALNSSSEGDYVSGVSESVINPVGTVSNLSRSQKPGENNRYVCYFDEYDDHIELQFRLQKETVFTGETKPLAVGMKEKKAGAEGESEFKELNADSYTVLSDLAEKPDLSKFPLQAVARDGAGNENLNEGDWYRLIIHFNDAGSVTQESLDQKTLMIAVGSEQTPSQIQTDAIHAEIQFIRRDSFFLD